MNLLVIVHEELEVGLGEADGVVDLVVFGDVDAADGGLALGVEVPHGAARRAGEGVAIVPEQLVAEMVRRVQAYVPGYRLKQAVQFERFGSNNPVTIPGIGTFAGLKTSVFVEVQGAAHYLPAYAGNLDIMTSAGMATAEKIAAAMLRRRAA